MNTKNIKDDDLRNAIDQFITTAENYDDQLRDLENDIDKLEDRISDKNSEIESLSDEVMELKADIQRLEEALAEAYLTSNAESITEPCNESSVSQTSTGD